MNKYLKISLLSLIVVLCCTGCNGNVTRSIRHAGFNMGSKFECNAIYPKDKEDTSYEKIKFYTGGHIITTTGKLYEVSPSQLYANKQNCKEADTNIKVKANLDFSIVKGDDNKYYYLYGQSEVAAYSEVTTENKDYQLYDLLLKDADVIKVTTVDSNNGIYYALKDDGNVYKIVIGQADRNSPLQVTSIGIVYDYNDYGSKIIDYSYAGEQSIYTFIRTENKLFRVRATNAEKCSKYADVKCEYKMEEDNAYQEFKDRVIAYNGNFLMTDYKQTFTVAN